jgi:hypothetical protein
VLKPKRFISPMTNKPLSGALTAKPMFLPPVMPSTSPRPMNRVESVAMKVGTCSQVIRSPLISPIATPTPRQTASANQAEVSCRPGA